MDGKVNALNWFDISVSDLARAKKFYETVFGIKMETMEMGPLKMAGFPAEMGNGKVSGCLAKSEYHKPSGEGVLLYLNGNPNLQSVLDKVAEAGGKIMRPKTQISPEIGYMAVMIDTEGNAIGLHSNG